MITGKKYSKEEARKILKKVENAGVIQLGKFMKVAAEWIADDLQEEGRRLKERDYGKIEMLDVLMKAIEMNDES